MDRAVATITMPGLREAAQRLMKAGVILADHDIVCDTVSAIG